MRELKEIVKNIRHIAQFATNISYQDRKTNSVLALQDIKVKRNKFNNILLESSKESKIAIEKTTIQSREGNYTEYQKTKYLEIKRYYQFKQQLEYLEEHNIKSFEDIEAKIDMKRKEIKSKNIILKEEKKRLKEILAMQRDLNHLDTVKEEQLSKSDLYIHNIRFGGNRINYSKSDNDYWHINLPYSNENIEVRKKCTAYNEKLRTYTLYLVDDKKYELYDKNDNIIKSITGRGLEEYVMEKKKENDSKYKDYELNLE